MDPAFANLDSSTHLLSSSGAINAGDVDSLDLDATIIDIGAEFYNFGYVHTIYNLIVQMMVLYFYLGK